MINLKLQAENSTSQESPEKTGVQAKRNYRKHEESGNSESSSDSDSESSRESPG